MIHYFSQTGNTKLLGDFLKQSMLVFGQIKETPIKKL